jgi:LPS-assembly lipoprotein
MRVNSQYQHQYQYQSKAFIALQRGLQCIGTITLCLALCSCGFALKGASAPLPFKTVQLQASANSLLASDVAARLSSKGVLLSSQAHEMTPRIALSDEQSDKVVSSTTTTGRVREYKLRQQVTVQVFGSAGQAWLEPVTLMQSRDFSYNDSQILAKEIEEQTLYKDMQQELVLVVMRRLDTLGKVAMPASAPHSAPLLK